MHPNGMGKIGFFGVSNVGGAEGNDVIGQIFEFGFHWATPGLVFVWII
jgi:hypothetical protein